MGKKKTQFDESLTINTYTWNMYYDRLKEMAISMYEWINLPNSVDERF